MFDAINRLKRREREIMYMRFSLWGDPLTKAAQKLDISWKSYISRLEKKIIDKIKKVLKTK
ncbi:MAG: sigma factor-like helix-turn-helix DNA-binding protein [Clostridium baratii]